MWEKVLWLSIAGACGTVSRFYLFEICRQKTCPIPLGTITVNVLGSFLFGFLYVIAGRKLNLSPETQVILLTGFMGAFTTFSAFAYETAQLMRSAQWALAFGNVFLNVALCLFALALGVLLARVL